MPDARHIEIEVKRPGNKPTPKQLEWLKHMTSLGAVSFWTDNTNDCEYVVDAILQGGKIVWRDDDDYFVEMR